jgi:LacI family transcriptional regulator
LREVFNAKTVDGLLFNIWRGGQVRVLSSPQVPWILLSDEDGVDDDVDLVALDVRETARRLAAYLLERGHGRLGLIVHLADIKFHRCIIEGAQTALRAAGLEPQDLKLIRPYFIEEVADDLLPLMKSRDAPTALLAATPGMATAALYALRCAGYAIPGDVSLVSLLDSERFRALPPVLTATDAQGEEHVEQAVNRLIEKIEGRQSAPRQIHIPGNLIERASVARPAAITRGAAI